VRKVYANMRNPDCITGNPKKNQYMLKTTAFTLLAGLVLATAAGAGTPAPVTPPPNSGLWTWFAGGSVGYLTETERPMYCLNLGMEYRQPGSQVSHSIYLQVGYARDDAGFEYPPPGSSLVGYEANSSIDMDIIPITLDYKYEGVLTGRLNYYVGLGLGIAVVDTSCNWSWSATTYPPQSGNGTTDHTDVRFYGEIFAGLSYNVTDQFQICAGARYILMDNVARDVHVIGASYDAGINNNVLLELGLRYHF